MTRPKILFVAVEFVFPVSNGVTIKSWNLVSRLARIADVTLVNLVAEGAEPSAEALAHVQEHVTRVINVQQGRRRSLAAIASLNPPFVTRYATRESLGVIRELTSTEQWDVIHLDCLGSGTLLPAIARRPRVLVSSPNDAYGLIVERRESPDLLGRAGAKLNGVLVRRFERQLYTACDQVHFVSEVDCAYAREHYPGTQAHCIPLGTRIPEEPTREENPNAIVFVANMLEGHGTSISRFAAESLPLIRSRVPAAELWAVGAYPPAALRAAAELDPGITVTGWVDDVQPWIDGAALALSINPLPGGMQNKVLGPMASGKAVVGLPENFVAIEGAVDGEHFVSASTPQALADEAVKLLQDPHRRRRIGAAARALIRERYTWDRVLDLYARRVLPPTR